MWLINTATLKLEYFSTHPKGEYAILSHTWGDGEVTFHDLQDIATARRKKGFNKIETTASLAFDQELRYAWVDTCCIDKSSSAELSEAINSMFRWYKHAAICFAYLVDMPPKDRTASVESQSVRLSACAWFTRGWTLQELIAPRNIQFYDSAWNMFGTKASLIGDLSTITRIEPDILSKNAKPRELPVACRMSWAADRHTTRAEDMAYCLLGIFDISMALLYGEGDKSFIRLQEEICKHSTDLSLFAWKAEAIPSRPWQQFRGIFARSPSEFRDCNEFIALPSRHLRYQGEFTVTNKGLRLDQMPLYTGLKSGILMALDCVDERTATSVRSQMAISLTKTTEGYVRSSPDMLFNLSDYYTPGDRHPGNRHENARIYISKELSKQEYIQVRKSTNELIEISLNDDGRKSNTKILSSEPKDLWDPYNNTFFSRHENCFFAVYIESQARFHGAAADEFIIVCGLNDPPNEAHSKWSRDLVYSGFTPQDPSWKPLAKYINSGIFQSLEVQGWVKELLTRKRDLRVSRGEPIEPVLVHGSSVTSSLIGDMVSGPTTRRFILTLNFYPRIGYLEDGVR